MTRTKLSVRRKKDLIFYIALITIPMAKFLVMWLYVKASALTLSFKTYVNGDYVWSGLDTFKSMFQTLSASENFLIGTKNALIMFALSTFVGTPLSLIFAFFVHKKFKGTRAMKLISYLPSLFSTVIQVMVYQYFVDNAIPEIWKDITGQQIPGLLALPSVNVRMFLIWFFGRWIYFGSSIILYVNQLDSIGESVEEAAKLDGAGFWQEFWYISFPLIFSLYITMTILSIPGILGNQYNLVEFYGFTADSDMHTIGYYMFQQLIIGGVSYYPFLSALGILMSAVIIPITLLSRKFLNKIDPMN